MNKKIMVACIAIILCIAVAMFFINLNKVEYANFADARNSDKIVQVIGKPLKSDTVKYVEDKPIFVFSLTDKLNVTEEVSYNGVKPMNFDLAEYVVIRGRYKNGEFVATEILTKCPSKYQPELKKRKEKQ
ncbi:MAG: cytochrome c maturation protein CcmE [Candidatus Kapabacteria bacterium]|nr:cytochrome c maturation protein CcmE [Candidatus Kapabacteria bacterium]